MLPLMQMHQMVQTPPHQLDPLASFQSQLEPDNVLEHPLSQSSIPTNPYQQIDAASLRAFPIRSSQPGLLNQHRVSASFSNRVSEQTEHQLRRKTPSGTIANGYDGTPTQLAAGPPALKHMALPATQNIFPTPVVHHGSQAADGSIQMPNGNSQFLFPLQAASGDGNGTLGGLDSTNPPMGTWGLAQNTVVPNPVLMNQNALVQSLPQQNYSYMMRMQANLGTSYQQSHGPAAFSPNGFTPSPLWGDNGFAEYLSPGPLNTTGYVPHNNPYDSAFVAVQAPLHQGALGGYPFSQGNPFRMPASAYSLDDGFSHHNQSPSALMHSPNRRMESLSLDSVSSTPTGETPSPARFKERALAHAHKTYAELLLYLSHTKKVQHAKSASGSRTSSKMIVFPKPPRQLSASLNLRSHQQPPVVVQPSAGFPFSSAQNPLGASLTFNSTSQSVDVQSPVGLTTEGRPIGGHQSIMAEIFGNPAASKFSFMGKTQHGHPFGHEMNSPLVNAKASLEMLTHLCEQSGWKWVDGILLGGCLHYGLEHYENALEWFKRIINLDPSHVEAISNIAATLYCLNRQEEAERHWLQAVKSRPSYLEAVEHLVGLLCSNHRNKEAVDTISYVQRALRIQELKPGQEHAARLKNEATLSSSASKKDENADEGATADESAGNTSATSTQKASEEGFGSSGYAVPGSENGRMVLLIHAKGNMLYTLKEVDRASESFEEAVLISAGRNLGGIRLLIRRIQTVLSPRGDSNFPARALDPKILSSPLLLHPDTAKHTAALVFASSRGQLPGLRYVPEGTHKKSVISTTSNALLSLAKIFQDTMSNPASSNGPDQKTPGVGDILALYYLSLSLQESPSTANNVGILLATVQQSSAQYAPASEAPAAQAIPGIVPGSGLALALAYYNYGLNLDPKHVHLHTNLGSLLKDIGQLDMAIQMYEQAVACDGTFDIALTNLANAVKDRGRISDAIIYYKRAVASNPEFAEAVCGLSTALNSVCDWRGRGGVLLLGGKYDRWHVDEEGMITDVKILGRGGGLMKRVVDIVNRQLSDSSTWGAGLLQENSIALLASQLKTIDTGSVIGTLDLESELKQWAGKPWEGSKLLRLIERSTRVSMHTWYHDKYFRGLESASGYPRIKPPGALTVPSAPTVLPFHTFTCPLTAKDIRMISQRNALRISCSTLRSPWVPSSVYPPPKPPNPQLNIGYVSSDFNNHPLAHLMQSVFGFHDPSRAKAFCYATTSSDKSIHRQQIEREAPVFRDVSSWSSERLVAQIIEDNIHILINLNGYTRGARNEIFAARPAPIQMSFMGFAGTLGAEWCDYLLADTTAIPPGTLRPWRSNMELEDVFRDEAEGDAEDWVYAENIIFCRDTFFCCDHAQSADEAERTITWEDEQRRRWKMRKELFPKLPDDTIILGNFNQLYKIDPTTFRTWLRILCNAPKAILWLLRFPELGENNLRRTAKAWAGEEVASRIIFTDVAPKQQHIARARVCDLFLDTPECNAHTTAADVLWSSSPLVTLPRYKYKMCSRIASSILKGALPKSPAGEQAAQELIVADDTQYEETAIKLANGLTYRITEGGYGEGAGRLAELRKLLFDSKWKCGLFNTRRWVSDLEDAYVEAWRRWVAGEHGDIYL